MDRTSIAVALIHRFGRAGLPISQKANAARVAPRPMTPRTLSRS